MTLIEAEFIIQHYYTVKPDESKIDDGLAVYSPLKWRKELSQRFHQIYQSIMASTKASQVILEYATMFHHDIRHCSTDSEFLDAYYGEGTRIKDIFMRVTDCLSVDNKAWLEKHVDDEMLQDVLLPCFYPVGQWGINITEHRCNRKEKEHP